MTPSRIVALVSCSAALLAAASPALADPAQETHAGRPGATSQFVAPVPGVPIGGLSSDNVEFVKNFPQHTDTAGARKVGNYFYITTERDLTIYDVTTPEDPVEVGSLVLPEPGQPVFTEEDPDTNGKILLISNGDVLMVIDVTDKTNPTVLSTLDGADNHTVSCILDCTWAYGSEGLIVDLRDPAEPRLSEATWQTDDVESGHDVTEVEPGIVLTATQPIKLLDARENPESPTVLGSTAKEADRFVHATKWPRGGTDDFMLVGGEAVGPGCAEDASATFSTWDARSFRTTGTAQQLDEFRVLPGTPDEGRAPDSSFCVHWFEEHPYYRNGGLIAIGWYEHGTRFLNIDDAGQITEVGWYMGGGGQASAAYWIDERTVYVADYLRGLDIVRFNGDIGTPPPGDGEPTAPPAEGSPAQDSPAQGSQNQAVPATQNPGTGSGQARGTRAARVGFRIKALRRSRGTLRIRISLRPVGGRFDLEVRRGGRWRRLATASARRSFVTTVPRRTLLRARTAAPPQPRGSWRVRRVSR